MAVLKIKDAEGNWQNIVALKGDRGERGPEGPVGPAGGVNSVNGMTGDVTIESYSLPTASSNTLGGVKVGSNITNSSGTISLTKSNVTNALGYTPLQTAPVTSVNGKTGAVSISNVNSATKLATPRTITLTGDATGSARFDGSGDVSIDVTVSGGGSSVDTSTLIPKIGERGQLAGQELSSVLVDTETQSGQVINASSPDLMFIVPGEPIHVEDGIKSNVIGAIFSGQTPPSVGESWTKAVLILDMSASLGGEASEITFASNSWRWAGGVAPTLVGVALLILHWNCDAGVAAYVPLMASE